MLLRPRQHVFVERALTALTERGNALAVAPTGFGKTVALAAIVGRLLAGGGRALVLQHRAELLAQNVATFRAMNADIPTSVVDAGARTVPTDLWREYLLNTGVLDPNASNPRADFKRLKDQLAERDLVSEWNGLMWAVAR